MRGAVLASVTAHVVVLAVVYFGLPLWLEPAPTTEQPIVVELVALAEKTVAAPEPPAPEPDPVPEPPPPAPAVPAAPPSPPPPPQPEPLPEPEPAAEPAPEPALVEALPAAAALPRPKPAAPVVIATPRPRSKPEPPPQRPDFDAGRIAALLDKSAAPEAEAPPVAAAAPVIAPQAPPVRLAARLAVSEVDAFRAQIERCWSVPAGALDAQDLRVRLRIFMNRDGSLAAAPEILERERMDQPGQEFFRTAAESARRAVLQCEPYGMLPPAKYDLWREIELTFNPRAMLDRG